MKRQKSLTLKYEQQKIRQGFSFVVGCDEVGRGCLAGPVVACALILDLETKATNLRGVRDSKMLNAKQRELFDDIIKQNSLGWGIGVVDEKTIDKINIHHASLLAMKKAVENLLSKVSDETSVAIPETLSLPAGKAGTPERLSGIQIHRLHQQRNNHSVLDSGYLHSPANSGMTPGGLLGSNLLSRDDNKNIFVVVDGKFLIPEFNMQQEAVVDGDAKILSVAAASIVAKVYRDNLMRKLHVKFPKYGFEQHKGYATFHHREAIKRFGLIPSHRMSFCGQYI